ncbi:hypothetical protein SADUNF_Sadunf18G0002900 [Salix dunnii]|uniref:tRNA (guanine(46)-N(7))-methyltransferase n=1 Tax=Salix dunnii TaxID=1413687 RepID=A0A835J3F6_9ROSI|nr:hypothetical protein SADUNF_SadunfUnG0006400 [Salix dunnii]KAF9661953.1 hypothetical protein SADUNF_Sadunf18G0002900 [Salix dunnii]
MLENEANPTISKSTGLPRRRFYRIRAHSNPLSDSHFPVPISPSHVDFSLHYPQSPVKLAVSKSPHLLDEYAHVHEVGGIIYTITDVEELGEWMKTCLDNHPMFEALTEQELQANPAVKLLSTATEEGQKVAWNGGQTFQAVYRRIALSL